MHVGVTLGVLCTAATCRANPTFFAMEEHPNVIQFHRTSETAGGGEQSPGQKIESRDNLHAFKRVGNEAQFKFTKQMLDHTQEAQECMKRNDEGYEKATQEMEAAEALLLNRQKTIKLADRSELGWSVVEEYEADELADNSEDEKIVRAEKEAERKALKRRKDVWMSSQLRSDSRRDPDSALLQYWVRALVAAKSGTFAQIGIRV